MNHDHSKSIKKEALALGFDDVGIASVDGAMPYDKEFSRAALSGRLGPLDYLYKTLEQRESIRSFFPEAQSVVVVIKNYYTGDFPDSAKGEAKIARYAWGKDYHQWFKKQLKKMKDNLQKSLDYEVKFWLFNDTGPFLERAWAKKAGLGFIGKSSMFISRKFGTWTLIGGFATDLVLSPDQPYEGFHCGSCTRCLDACPTQAIIAPGIVDARLCISTWTIERPLHESSIKNAPRDHQWGFGCDVCQEVCPWNKFQVKTEEERFKPLIGRVYFSKETFNQDLRGSPLNRASKAGLRANYLRIQKTLTKPNLRIISSNLD